MIIQRRNFLIGLASALAAPAIVKAANIMPVKLFKPYSEISMRTLADFQVGDIVYRLDIMYGKLTMKSPWIITAISENRRKLTLDNGSTLTV